MEVNTLGYRPPSYYSMRFFFAFDTLIISLPTEKTFPLPVYHSLQNGNSTSRLPTSSYTKPCDVASNIMRVTVPIRLQSNFLLQGVLDTANSNRYFV